jgi:hypothetical protein
MDTNFLEQKPHGNKGHIPWNKGKPGCFSSDTRAKMRESRKGRITWPKGKKHSPKTRAKMSVSHTGIPNPSKGKKRPPLTAEHKKKLSTVRMGKPAPQNAGKNNWLFKDGLSQHNLGHVYAGMMARCYKPKSTSYPDYGAKGAIVWEPWHERAAFIFGIEALLGPRPEGYTLDRINPHEWYYEWNVRWADKYTQHKNLTKNTFDYYSQSGEH